MRIAKKYHGNEHVVIIRDSPIYFFLSRKNSETLAKDVLLYTKEKDVKIIERYEGININAIVVIAKAIERMNEVKKVNLEMLLK